MELAGRLFIHVSRNDKRNAFNLAKRSEAADRQRSDPRLENIPASRHIDASEVSCGGWRDASGYVCPKLASRYRRDVPGISLDYTWLLKKAGIVTTVERKGMKSQVLHSFHSLRHTFVSRLAEKGVSPLVIQRMSGHTTMEMTERYTHIGLEAKRKALTGSVTSEDGHAKANIKPASQETSAQQKLEALKILLKGKLPDEVIALL